MRLTEAQTAEIAKYDRAYQSPNYRMSEERRRPVREELAGLSWRDSYLDVGCGRGEMLTVAQQLGYGEVHGTETCEALVGGKVTKALAWTLPFTDSAMDVVSMFDVIEHLLPGDDERACRELGRVARRCVLITANNRPSLLDGVELHVNRRPYEEWDELFHGWFPDAEVSWLKHRRAKYSEFWRIDLL